MPRELVFGDDAWQGLRDGDVAPYLERISTAAEYRPRGEAEEDPSWKQVIPYLLLQDDQRLFLMRRTRAGNDARLHERWSIGIGGHLNPGDADLQDGLLREFNEEVEADWVPRPRLLGLLNDDSTLVGAVHLGVVYVADAAGRPIAIRETHKLSGEFVAPEAVERGYEHLETWSQIVYDYVTGRNAGARQNAT